MKNKHEGSTFDSFLKEEGLLDQVEAVAIKRVVAYEFEKHIAQKQITKTDLASKMHTSRTALDRVLDPNNTSITLNSLVRIANALGKKIEISLVN